MLRGGYGTYYLRVASRLGHDPVDRSYSGGFRCVSGLNFTTGPSAGGVFTSDEEASSNEEVPLLLAHMSFGGQLSQLLQGLKVLGPIWPPGSRLQPN